MSHNVLDGTLGLPRIATVHLLQRALNSGSGHDGMINIHFNKRLEKYTQDADGVTVHFTDGSIVIADVLVGADGIGSRTRRAMYSDLANRVRDVDPEKAAELEKHVEPTFTGTYQYRALVDGNKLREKSPNNVSLTESATVRPSTLSVR